MCICWHCFFFFLNRNLGSHSWITLLRVVAWIQVFFFFFVSSDTRIPEDTRAQHLRGPPSSCFLGATHNLMLQDHTLMLQECSVPRKTTEATGVPSPASWSLTRFCVNNLPLWLLNLIAQTNQTWNWRSTVLKTIKMIMVRPPMTNFKATVRADCAVSVCSPLPLPLKALAHWLSGVGGVELWTGVCPQPSQLPASKIKQTFLSTNLISLLAFGWQAAGPYFRLQIDSQT